MFLKVSRSRIVLSIFTVNDEMGMLGYIIGLIMKHFSGHRSVLISVLKYILKLRQ